MSWADHAKKELAEGRDVQIRPRGNSMRPKVNDGDLVDLAPIRLFQVWRQDDNGNHFKVGASSKNRKFAEAMAEEYERRAHKQTYYVKETCAALKKGSIVLVKWARRDYLHLVKAVQQNKDGFSYQIGNNRGGINGWVSPSAIWGVATKISSPGKGKIG